MAKEIVPANDLVLILDIDGGTKLGDIDMPDNVRQKDMLSGRVIAVGLKVSDETKKDDLVLYGPYAGKMTSLEGVQFRLVREGQIEAYVRDNKVSNGDGKTAIA